VPEASKFNESVSAQDGLENTIATKMSKALKFIV
jgi:hypothetical protein